MKLPAILLMFACALAPLATVAADRTPVYKWTDAQGVVHYSDKAPARTAKNVKLLALPELPPVNLEAIKREQAYIASINAWYQQVLNRQSQFQYDQYLARQESEPQTTPAPSAATELSYVSPLCWDCGRLWHRPYYRRPVFHAAPAQPPGFKSNIWSTQPNRFTRSLYRPQ